MSFFACSDLRPQSDVSSEDEITMDASGSSETDTEQVRCENIYNDSWHQVEDSEARYRVVTGGALVSAVDTWFADDGAFVIEGTYEPDRLLRLTTIDVSANIQEEVFITSEEDGVFFYAFLSYPSSDANLLLELFDMDHNAHMLWIQHVIIDGELVTVLSDFHRFCSIRLTENSDGLLVTSTFPEGDDDFWIIVHQVTEQDAVVPVFELMSPISGGFSFVLSPFDASQQYFLTFRIVEQIDMLQININI